MWSNPNRAMNPVAELETGVIYCDDNLARLRKLPDGCVDLIYLDPPFFSNRTYEVIWGDEAEVRSFEDRWEGGIHHYADWMKDRLFELHRVLKPDGSIYLHCDPHASHYLKVTMDNLFGAECFRSEIIWKRTSAHSSAKRYGPVHDTILFYSRGERYAWNPQYQEYDPSYLETFFDQHDSDGRRWKRSDLTGAGTRRGETGKPWRGIDVTAKGRHWAHPPARLDELDAEGHVHWPRKEGGMPRLKQYPEDLPGVPLQDVWTDIRPMHNLSQERLGWPTQKPEALLERLIRASSSRGDIVLDPFCGCGTTIAVAEQLNRRWVGIDISPQAVKIMKRRVDSFGANATVKNLPTTLADLRKLGHFEFQNWVVDAVNGVQRSRRSRDLGIDGYSFFHRHPIQVKQSERVGRNVVDNFETAIERDGKEMGYIVAFSFTRDAYGEAARTREIGKNMIHLVRVSDILELNDIILAALAARTKPDLSHVEPAIARLVAGALEDRKFSRAEISPEELIASAAAAA